MIKELQKALKEDEGYRIGWKANIAMAYVDTVQDHPDKTVHEVANIAADRFLDNLCRDCE